MLVLLNHALVLLNRTRNILTAHCFVKPEGQKEQFYAQKYVSLETEFESFIFEFELLNLNN